LNVNQKACATALPVPTTNKEFMEKTKRYFYEVAITGSLRKASERLHVATSAISRKIQLLEEQLGADLFERVPQGMVLTQVGEVYFEHIQHIMQEEERVRSEVDALKGLQRGHVRIISVEGAVADFIVRAFEEFRRSYPGVCSDIKVDGSHLVRTAIRNREMDIGISMSGRPDPLIDIALRINDPLLAVMAPDHALAQRKSLQVQEIIDGYPFALPDTNFGIRTKVDECIKYGKAEPAMIANSIAALRGYARFGGGITFLTFLAVREDLMDGKLVGIPLADPELEHITVDVMVAKGRRLPLPALKLLEFLQKVAKTMNLDHTGF